MIDHIIFVRGGDLEGTLHILTRAYTKRQRDIVEGEILKQIQRPSTSTKR